MMLIGSLEEEEDIYLVLRIITALGGGLG